MYLAILSVLVLVTSSRGLSIPSSPALAISQASPNSSYLTIGDNNGTKPHLLGEWPSIPFYSLMVDDKTFTIHAYGRALAPAANQEVLDSMTGMIYHLKAAGNLSDAIRHLEVTSTDGLIEARFGSVRSPGEALTRLEAVEVLDLVWALTAAYGPREILMAELEEDWEEGRGLISLFTLKFPTATT